MADFFVYQFYVRSQNEVPSVGLFNDISRTASILYWPEVDVYKFIVDPCIYMPHTFILDLIIL
jgi:hypothetical protein